MQEIQKRAAEPVPSCLLVLTHAASQVTVVPVLCDVEPLQIACCQCAGATHMTGPKVHCKAPARELSANAASWDKCSANCSG